MLLFAAVDHCLSSPCKNGATCTRRVDAYICKCAPGFHGRNCDKGGTTARMSVRVVAVVINDPFTRVPAQLVRPHTAVAIETEDVNISAGTFQIVPMCVSALRATVWIGTTAPVSLKVSSVEMLRL